MTPRQIRMAQLVAQGLTNRQIAERLGCSPRTVGNTLSAMYASLGISRRTELAVMIVARTSPAASRLTGDEPAV
jgi:DNA-binding CsgD family transcriptional regulator